MSKEIKDFTNYAEPFDFTYSGYKYRIPALNKPQIEKLMSLNSEISELDESEDGDDDKLTKEQVDKSKSYFSVQDKFICSALFKEEEGKFRQVIEEDLEDWPIKLKNRIMKEISEQMAVSDDEDESEKKS